MYRITKEEIDHREVAKTGFLIVVFNAVTENASHRKRIREKCHALLAVISFSSTPLPPLLAEIGKPYTERRKTKREGA